MKKTVLFLGLIGAFYCLSSMQDLADKAITVVIQKNAGLELNQPRLHAIQPNYVFITETSFKVTLYSNNKGEYDITPFLKAEHEHTFRECNALVLAELIKGREQSQQMAPSIPFLISGCQKFSNWDFNKYMSVFAQEHSFITQEVCQFSLKATKFQGNDYFDLSGLIEEIWNNAFILGQKCQSRVTQKPAEAPQSKAKKAKQQKVKMYTGYSKKQMLTSFGIGAGLVGIIWWIKSHH